EGELRPASEDFHHRAGVGRGDPGGGAGEDGPQVVVQSGEEAVVPCGLEIRSTFHRLTGPTWVADSAQDRTRGCCKPLQPGASRLELSGSRRNLKNTLRL